MDKKGSDIVDIDLTKIHNAICDHFIICHADSIEKKVREKLDQKVHHREGLENAMWILLDYNDIIVHVFQKDYREYYKLEELWGDAVVSHLTDKYN